MTIKTGTPLVINKDGTIKESKDGDNVFGYALGPIEPDGTISIKIKNSPTQIVLPPPLYSPLHISKIIEDGISIRTWKTIEEEQYRESSNFPDNNDYNIFAENKTDD